MRPATFLGRGLGLAIALGAAAGPQRTAGQVYPVSPQTASCGCSEEKMARVAEATRKFSAEVDDLVHRMTEATTEAETHRGELPALTWKAEAALASDLASAETACRQRAPMPGVAMPQEARVWYAACDRLADSARRYRTAMRDMEAELHTPEGPDQARAGLP